MGTITSSRTMEEPVIAVPIIATPSDLHRSTTKVSAPPQSAFKYCSSPSSTMNTSTTTASTASMTTLEDESDWVGIDEDYWVIDGQLIEEDEAQRKCTPTISIVYQRLQDWVKLKRDKCRPKKQPQQQQHQQKNSKKRNCRNMAKVVDDPKPQSSSDMSLLVHKSNTTNSYYFQDQQQQGRSS